MGKRNRNDVVAPPPRSLRAQSRAFFPQQSRTFKAQWVLAKMRLNTRRYHQAPIGTRAIPPDALAPDFLRILPRDDTAHLQMTPTAREQLRSVARFALRLIHG